MQVVFMFKIGDTVKCIVTGFKEYGIFVKINDEYNGLIHISEISSSFVHNVADYAEIGEEIYAKVIDVNEMAKHLKLSIKNINYKIDGKEIAESNKNGFLPLKEHLGIWINEKLKEINKDKQN